MSTISFSQVGQNLLLNVDGKSLSRRFANKDERDVVKLKLQQYNQNPNQDDLDNIIGIFTNKTDSSKTDTLKAERQKLDEKQQIIVKQKQEELKKEVTKATSGKTYRGEY